MRSLLTLLGVLSCCATLVTAAEKDRPNILFIFADDLAPEVMSYYGGQARTPHLDRLARRSVVFTNTYNMGSWTPAVCVASRAMLNTGRFLWNAQALDSRLPDEVEGGRMWSQRFQQAGYATYFTGKWHVHVGAESVFDYVGTVRGGMPHQNELGTVAGYNRPQSEAEYASGWAPWDPQYGGYWEGGIHWSEITGDESVAFLEQAADDTRPFFAYLAFNAPHDPRQAPREQVEQYSLDEIEVPENYLEAYPFRDDIGAPHSLRDERLAPMPRTEFAVRVQRREYYAIITHLDKQVGRILDALEASGKADNTYIIFSADHGLAVGRHGFMGKQNSYEHSVRSPLFISGPGLSPGGTKIDDPLYIQDIMPTALELAGIPIPVYVEFRSLVSHLIGHPERQWPSIYNAYLDQQRMIRRGDHKLMVYPGINRVRLYNLKEDPWELNDLSSRPESRPILHDLLSELRIWQKECNDPLKISYGQLDFSGP